MIDKSELLHSGKHFGRIFLDQLCENEVFKNGRGGIKQDLADELLAIGQSEGLTEKEHIAVMNVRNWRDGKHKIPYWVNCASLLLVSEVGFKITHPADAIAVIATVLVDFTDSKSINLKALLIYIEQRYGISVDTEYYPIIIGFLHSKNYEILDAE